VAASATVDTTFSTVGDPTAAPGHWRHRGGGRATSSGERPVLDRTRGPDCPSAEHTPARARNLVVKP
jgi:hypothetical protein